MLRYVRDALLKASRGTVEGWTRHLAGVMLAFSAVVNWRCQGTRPPQPQDLRPGQHYLGCHNNEAHGCQYSDQPPPPPSKLTRLCWQKSAAWHSLFEKKQNEDHAAEREILCLRSKSSHPVCSVVECLQTWTMGRSRFQLAYNLKVRGTSLLLPSTLLKRKHSGDQVILYSNYFEILSPKQNLATCRRVTAKPRVKIVKSVHWSSVPTRINEDRHTLQKHNGTLFRNTMEK